MAAVRHRVSINTLDRELVGSLGFNEIGGVLVETKRPLFSAHAENRATGAFILIDPLTNETVAAGMITGRVAGEMVFADELPPRPIWSTASSGRALHPCGTPAMAIWLEGTEELAYALERKLFDRGCLVQVLQGEGVAAIAQASIDAGLISICVIAEDDAGARESLKQGVGSDRFLAARTANLPEDPEHAAEQICRTLEERGYIRPQPKPFTGGAGI